MGRAQAHVWAVQQTKCGGAKGGCSVAKDTGSICNLQGTQQPKLGKPPGTSGSFSVSAEKARVQKWLEKTEKQRQQRWQEKTTSKRVKEVEEQQKDEKTAPREEDTDVLNHPVRDRTDTAGEG